MNIFENFRNGLKKSSSFLSNKIINTLKSNYISEDIVNEIESILISADIGLEVTNQLIDKIKKSKISSSVDAKTILELIASEIYKILSDNERPLAMIHNAQPNVMIFLGVNGCGKTTSIGKLISKLKSKNKILVAACDTFRAAAVDQLKEWSKKDNVNVFEGSINQDPASVAFKACEKAIKENYDYLIIDTAGRLSNNTNLVNQLIKIQTVIQKLIKEKQINNILVLDGTNGSNMISQVETFNKAISISGLIITKLDGTAKGGAIISIAKKYQIPIHFIGLGEKEHDLYDFNAKAFSYSLLNLSFTS